MEQPNSAAFRRSISFTRSRKRNGLFSWPVITYNLMREDGREAGSLVIKGRKATYTSSASPGDELLLKKNIWGTRWMYAGDGEREFGRSSFSWNFKPAFVFASGERFYLRAKRRWPFRSNKAGAATQSAAFSKDDTPVMLLQSFAPAAFFSNEVYAPLEGTLATDLTGMRIVAGLLIFYQGFLEARNRRAH